MSLWRQTAAKYSTHLTKSRRRVSPGATSVYRNSLRVYRPESGLAHAVVGWPGMIGSSVGMNESGLAVSSLSLQAAEPHQPPASLRTLLVRRILAHAPDIASAVTLLFGADATIEAEFCLSHSLSAQICVVRLHADGEHETLYRNGVASLAEEHPLALVGRRSKVPPKVRRGTESLRRSPDRSTGNCSRSATILTRERL